MSIKKIFLVGTMSILSTLFGCTHKSVDISGPDHKNGSTSVIYIDQAAHIEYTLPGNLSSQFGFEKVRDQDERTKRYNLAELDNEDFETNKWRSSKFIDAGRWDYLGPKNKGLAGELGWLNLTLELNSAKLPDLSESGFREHIKGEFLRFIASENKEISKHYPRYSEENLAHVLLPPPDSFDWIEINGSRFLTWLSNETKGSPSSYYIFPLSQQYFLSIIISHHTSVNDEKLRERLMEYIQQDSSQILDSFVINK